MYIPWCTLVAYLSQFGVVKAVSWDKSKITGYESVKTTVRNVVLKVDSGVNIPSEMELFYEDRRHKMLVTIPGRGPVCFKCKKNRTYTGKLHGTMVQALPML